MKLRDTTAYLLSTGCGVGLSALAPGTLGAVEGIVIYLACVAAARFLETAYAVYLLGSIDLLVCAIGIWAADRVARAIGEPDPQRVIIDEVAGQMIALTPLAASPSVLGVVVAFVLFRLFDIFKPYPIRKLEHLPGGFGVMFDDVLAGVFAGALTLGGRLLQLF